MIYVYYNRHSMNIDRDMYYVSAYKDPNRIQNVLGEDF